MNEFQKKCRRLLDAYKSGDLGQTVMPEDSHPQFKNDEERLVYFTLPMALNYQRDSYKLWDSALVSYQDSDTKDIFNIKWSATSSEEELRKKLLKHKLALQPNKHIQTWQKIAKTIYENWGNLSKLFENTEKDFLKLKQVIQKHQKAGFPYLSGPKIFNYWSFIVSTYGGQNLKNLKYVEIAPDTHITKCSVLLGVITKQQAEKLTKEQISEIWREKLEGSGITPIEMHPPLWFWSKNGFIYEP